MYLAFPMMHMHLMCHCDNSYAELTDFAFHNVTEQLPSCFMANTYCKLGLLKNGSDISKSLGRFRETHSLGIFTTGLTVNPPTIAVQVAVPVEIHLEFLGNMVNLKSNISIIPGKMATPTDIAR